MTAANQAYKGGGGGETSEPSPTTVLAGSEELLACALGIVGLQNCTPRLQPTAAMPPPMMAGGGLPPPDPNALSMPPPPPRAPTEGYGVPKGIFV